MTININAELLMTIGLFFGLQVINVILNTGKTLVMSRTDNPHTAAIINAVTFGFYTAIVKQIATLDLTITIIVTMVTNVIGVYITYAIMKKLRKDNLWKVEIYCPMTQYSNANFVRQELEKAGVPCKEESPTFVTAYCYTQGQSEKTREIIKKHNAKYNITEITKKF
jgi:hypothetical protein